MDKAVKVEKTIEVVDDPAVREIYSNRMIAASYDGAVLKVTLACMRDGTATWDDSAVAVVNNRWCIPEAVALKLHKALGAAIEKMIQRRPTAPPSPLARSKTKHN